MPKHLREGGAHDYMHPLDEGYRPKHRANVPPKEGPTHRRKVGEQPVPLVTGVSLHKPKHRALTNG